MSENEFNEQYNKPAIWKPSSIGIIAALFSFIPAGIMEIINYKKLGYSDKAKKRTFFLIASTIGFFILAMFIESQLIFTGINAGLGALYYNEQKDLYEKHIKLGGKKASVLIPVLLSILFTFILIVITS